MSKIIIASGPVIVECGRVLLNQHGDTDFWKFCGGRVENFDESLIEAAKREAREEMGIELKIKDPIPFVMHTIKKTAQGDVDVLLVHYLAERVGEINPGADIDKWRWFSVDDLKNEKLAPNIIITLKHFNFLK